MGKTKKNAHTTAPEILPGTAIYIMTVTYAFTGRVVRETPDGLWLNEAAWIAETARLTDTMAKGDFNEVEVFPPGMVIEIKKAAIVASVPWPHPLPDKQK